MSFEPSAMCWMPSPLYSRRNSSIWLLSSWLSLSGMRILPHGDVGGAELERAGMSGFRILYPERHRAGARAMLPGISLSIASRLGVDDEVAVALLVQSDVLALVPGDLGKAHFGEQGTQQLDI